MSASNKTTESDRALVRDLETCAIEAGGFHHADHVRAAWVMLQEQHLDSVVPRFAQALRRFAAHQGAYELYHETITRAFLIAIDHRIRSAARPLDWAEFREAHPELFEDFRLFLSRHYSPEILASKSAKESFAPPDREPLAAVTATETCR